MPEAEQTLARQSKLVQSLFIAHETDHPMSTEDITLGDMLTLTRFARDLSDLLPEVERLATAISLGKPMGERIGMIYQIPIIYRCTTPVGELTYLPGKREATMLWQDGKTNKQENEGLVKTVHLSNNEGLLLKDLMLHQGRPRSRIELHQAIWGDDAETYSNSRPSDVLVHKLRRKIGDDSQTLIVTMRSIGHCIPSMPVVEA